MLDLELRFNLIRGRAFNRHGERTFDQGKEERGIERMCDEIVRIAVKNPQKVPQV